MENYIIVLFKNKKKRRIIKGYSTEKNAIEKFNTLKKENKVLFPVEYENAEYCAHELGLLTTKRDFQLPLFLTDEYGRNEKVFVEGESHYTFLEVNPYDIEETIHDWQTEDKITLEELISKYCPIKEMKSISSLNNKIIVQVDEDFKLFSLKNIEDCQRCLQIMEKHFRQKGRKDAFFVKDTSTTQRKWLYNILEEKGFDRRKLYRQTTTYSKRA